MSNGFAKLGIRDTIVDSLRSSGVTEPTPIQKQAIPALLSGSDVIAQAQTGTGKTLAFVLPMLELIDVSKPHIQGLILTPTRELAIQISSELSKLAPIIGAKVLAAYGGQDVERQLKKLQGTIHIVVATPGRLLDHLRRESLQLYKLNMLVLDEADQMLHMGFLTEVQDIIDQTSSQRQTLLFSATMPQQIRNLAKAYMKSPIEIQVESKQVTLTEIDQTVIQTTDRGKQDALIQAIKEHKPYLAMIFCRTKRRASALNEALQEAGFASDELHGDLSQAKREQVMKRFRDAKIELLVATDVAARGLDVEGVTHVYNYDIPHDAESYIHRIGRTGRAGQRGMAVTFASQRDMFYLDLIEKGIKMQIRRAGETVRRDRGSDREETLSRRSSAPDRRSGGTGRAGTRGVDRAGREGAWRANVEYGRGRAVRGRAGGEESGRGRAVRGRAVGEESGKGRGGRSTEGSAAYGTSRRNDSGGREWSNQAPKPAVDRKHKPAAGGSGKVGRTPSAIAASSSERQNGERSTYGRQSGERPTFGKQGSERFSFGRQRGERSSDRRGGPGAGSGNKRGKR